MKIVRAELEQVKQAAELFDLYRQFYDQPADPARAEDFIRQRIVAGESAIFLALENEAAVGFTQLYPSFCSVEAVKIQILYDLFVKDEFRRRGVAEALMARAAAFARDSGARRIDLLTGIDNRPGQALYEKLGYRRVPPEFFPYSLEVNDR
jgi:ribosomal protein S18 acetylase RimI-like enzyme